MQELKRNTGLVEKLQKTETDILDMIAIRNKSDLEREAALQIARTSDSEWNIRDLGIQSLRSEIQMLQRKATESDSLVRNLELCKDSVSRKLSDMTATFSQDEANACQLLVSAKSEWSRELSRLSDGATHIQEQINQSAAFYDEVTSEIRDLEQDRLPIPLFTDETDISDSESTESLPECSNLVQQKQTLEAEVTKLRKALNAKKRKVKKRQHETISQIRMLYCMYSKQVASENDFRAGNILYNDYMCSDLEIQIQALVQKIDISMAELRNIAIDR
jgi:hypothetical protein